jgi:hypothetical protein
MNKSENVNSVKHRILSKAELKKIVAGENVEECNVDQDCVIKHNGGNWRCEKGICYYQGPTG